MHTIEQALPKPDYAAVKMKQNAAWTSGDYAKIGVTLQLVGEELAETMDLTAGDPVLDVAAGNGNATLAFARRGGAVTSTDYVEALLMRGRDRADAEGLSIEFVVADAEALPFDNDSFTAVVSTFGVMFTPNQPLAASELLRVVKPGGRIGLANWTPTSFIGALFSTLGLHVPPPPGVQSPALWGSEDWLVRTFSPRTSKIGVVAKNYVFRYRSPEEFVDIFAAFYGPVHKAFLALDEAGQGELRSDILDTIAAYNTAVDGCMRVPSEYLEVIMTKA
ncbi:MAG: class I SAM-dependent methyltransferase [Hyphomicrobiaceae bacterium]